VHRLLYTNICVMILRRLGKISPALLGKMSPGELRDSARDLGRHSLGTEVACVYAFGGGAGQKRIGMIGRDGLTGLRAYARAVDGDGVATFA
jgi:hypothetical protein